jgi:hypothetical protein
MSKIIITRIMTTFEKRIFLELLIIVKGQEPAVADPSLQYKI